jgi:DNA-binding response OmpR family regulator
MPEKLLIVDDDLETLRLISMMLQRQGYQVVTANDGRQALLQADSEHPDLIILDVMMPDMNGFEVASRLRAQPQTTSIPILMFTAKSQVEDKVAGYEAGVDDYLTKPIHPAELSARLKALLARTRSRPTAAPTEKGHVIGVAAAKGGLGVSTLTLNLALALFNRTKEDIIAVEISPGHGTWGMELGYSNTDGLTNILRLKPSEINRQVIERELTPTTYGIRLLLSSPKVKDVEYFSATAQMETLLNQLPLISPMVLLDIGNSFPSLFDKIVSVCQEIILVTEPYPSSVQRTRILMDNLAELGVGKSKLLTVVIINRVRADIQLPISQIQDILKQPVAQVIPPAPEQAYSAALKNVPLSYVQSEGLVSQQFTRLAEVITQRLHK